MLRKILKRKGFESCPAADMRIIAVSATIPNVLDIATWLEVYFIFTNNFKFIL